MTLSPIACLGGISGQQVGQLMAAGSGCRDENKLPQLVNGGIVHLR